MIDHWLLNGWNDWLDWLGEIQPPPPSSEKTLFTQLDFLAGKWRNEKKRFLSPYFIVTDTIT